MNYEFLEAQIKEAKDCIKYYTRKAVVAKAMMHIEGCDIDYERHQIELYESMVTDNENLLDIFFTARDLSQKLWTHPQIVAVLKPPTPKWGFAPIV